MEIRTEDGQTVALGGRAFNYYDRKPGMIGFDLGSDGWFTFVHDDGTSAVLNGERVCSLSYAAARGWWIVATDEPTSEDAERIGLEADLDRAERLANGAAS